MVSPDHWKPQVLSLSATSTVSVRKVDLELENLKPVDSRSSPKDATKESFVSTLEKSLDDADVLPANKTMSKSIQQLR